MDRFKHHFTDANVIIASLISWDSAFERSSRYFAEIVCHRHTSSRVYYECKGVIEGRRRLLLNFISEFYNNIDAISEKGWNPENNIEKFVSSYIRRLEDKKNKIVVRQFSRVVMDDMKALLLGSTRYRDFLTKVVNAFKFILNELDSKCNSSENSIIKRHDICPKAYTNLNHYSEKEDKLMRIINYHPDILVLLDSYYLRKKIIKDDIAFITFDNEHILKNKLEIEKILSGIHVLSP